MKPNDITRIFGIALWSALFLGLSGCAGKTTTPRANMISGSLTTLEGFAGSYTILQWKKGLVIFMINDSQSACGSFNSDSTDEPIWWGHGSISPENGQGVTWRVETTLDKARLRLSGTLPNLWMLVL